MDSNHRRCLPADLQSAPFGHSGTRPFSMQMLIAKCTINFRIFVKDVSLRHPCFRASCRIRTNDPEITNHVLWPTELKRHSRFRFQASFACLRLQIYDSFLNWQNIFTLFYQNNLFPISIIPPNTSFSTDYLTFNLVNQHTPSFLFPRTISAYHFCHTHFDII